jgi:hypothetical protein
MTIRNNTLKFPFQMADLQAGALWQISVNQPNGIKLKKGSIEPFLTILKHL